MTFSGHIAISVLVLSTVSNPLLIVALCFMLHLAADAIPHLEWQSFTTASPRAKALISLDCVVTLLLVAVMYLYLPASSTVLTAGIIAGLLPDLTDQLARRHWPRFRYWHDSMHTLPQRPGSSVDWNKTFTGRTSAVAKLTVQIGLIALALGVVYLRSRGSL